MKKRLRGRLAGPVGLAVAGLVLAGSLARAQVAVPVGAGSYASSIPPAQQFKGGYYSMTAQQVVTQYVNLHLGSAVTNRPIPSNQWWTDLLVGDRSSQPAANVPRTIVQDAFGGQLWAYPTMVDAEAVGFNLYFPNAWTPSGSDPWVPQGPFMTGTALPITGGVPSGAAFSAVKSVVTGWRDWGVEFSLPDAGTNRMDITLARGVPFVWTRCIGLKPRINLGSVTSLYATNGAVIARSNSSIFTASAFAFDYQGRSWGVFAPPGTRFLTSGNYVEAQLSGTSNYLVYAVLPARTNVAEFAQYAYAQVTNTTYSWTYDITNGRVATTWKLSTSPLDGFQTNTLQGWLPHHYRTTSNNLAFKPYTYLTPRGRMKVAAGNQFRLDYDFRGLAPVLPAPQTNSLPNDYVVGRMTNYVVKFAAGHPNNVGDSYGAGKEVGISAQQMSFARQLGLTNQAAQLAAGVRGILSNWFTYTPGEANYFFARYANWRALVGFPASYGSEAFNDNHFHYGYFMAASALLAMEDAQFLTQYGPMARLVAKEYANWDRSDTNFPFLRTFDIWEGHSWAGGFSSRGGNNQESSSEAMNAWAGLFLLGNQLGDSAMVAAGAMGYAVESAAVNEYWQDSYHTNLPASYGKGMVGILWSGGLTYGTYFTGDPAWIYGIQWVPANHWNNYLARNKSFANWQLTNLWNERIVASQHNVNGFKLTDSNNAVALGGYLGNYVLGYQMLFDQAGVAAIMDAGYATNAAIATDNTYSGVTYYLTHTLRTLGDQALDYYTSIPTSQVYSNAVTGRLTAVIYNPAATNQTATIYRLGVPVAQVAAPARKLTVNVAGQTNAPSRIRLDIQPGAQIIWPTSNGATWTLQSANDLGTNVAWTTLLGPAAGDGTTNAVFDPLWPSPHRQYQVLEATAGSASVLVNGGFETGSGGSVSNWPTSGTQPPTRVSSDRHSGVWSMKLMVTNTAATPNNSALEQNVAAQGGLPVVAGRSYQLSFWVRQVSSGVSYVQNYRLGWLNASGGTISAVGWTGFTANSSGWTQVSVSGLVAPANAVNALIQIYSATGSVLNGYGGVLIDDVSLTYGTPSQTNVLAAVVQPSVQLSWNSTNGELYDLRWTDSLRAGNWLNLASSVVGNGSTNVIADVLPTNQQRFYRVAELP